MSEKTPKARYFSENGYNIIISKVRLLTPETLMYKLPKGITAGEIFEASPLGKTKAEPGKASQAVVELLQGAQTLFRGIDGGEYPKPTYLYCTTNPSMSAVATKYFGFEELKRRKRLFHKGELACVLVGETDTVRGHVEEMTTLPDDKGRTFVDRLKSRVKTDL